MSDAQASTVLYCTVSYAISSCLAQWSNCQKQQGPRESAKGYYSDGLKNLKLDSLKKRREKICLKFAKNCIQNDKVRSMFPRNKKNHKMKTRSPNVFQIQKAKTKRYKKSAMVSLLNKDALKNKKMMNFVEK